MSTHPAKKARTSQTKRVQKTPVIVILDLDHCLIHYLKPDEVNAVHGPSGAKDFAEKFLEVQHLRHTIALRRDASHLIRCLKSLGVELEIVTQNLDGERILEVLVGDDFDTWRGVGITVVKERRANSKKLINTKLYEKHIKKGYTVEELREFTLIVDDQESSWCLEDVNYVLEVQQFNLLRKMEQNENRYFKNLVEETLLAFFMEKNSINFSRLEDS